MIYDSYNVDLDIEFYKHEAEQLLTSPDSKIKKTGRTDLNYFTSVPVESKSKLSSYITNLLGITYDWNWEYFHSGEPVGLHTDYLAFPNVWNTTTAQDCHVEVGIIIPLDWNCKQPYTINYNRTTDVPRKMLFRNGEMRYIDNNEVVNYRDKWEYDANSLVYNPEGTDCYKQFADLKVHSVYKWKIGTALAFDTKRWHSSSWFLKDNTLPKISTEYKRSIIGFGSINYDIKT